MATVTCFFANLETIYVGIKELSANGSSIKLIIEIKSSKVTSLAFNSIWLVEKIVAT